MRCLCVAITVGDRSGGGTGHQMWRHQTLHLRPQSIAGLRQCSPAFSNGSPAALQGVSSGSTLIRYLPVVLGWLLGGSSMAAWCRCEANTRHCDIYPGALQDPRPVPSPAAFWELETEVMEPEQLQPRVMRCISSRQAPAWTVMAALRERRKGPSKSGYYASTSRTSRAARGASPSASHVWSPWASPSVRAGYGTCTCSAMAANV